MPNFACFRWLFWRTPHTLKLLNQVRPWFPDDYLRVGLANQQKRTFYINVLDKKKHLSGSIQNLDHMYNVGLAFIQW